MKNTDFVLVLTSGCFDNLNSDQIQSLEYAKKQGDYLLVAMNSNASIQRLECLERPVNDEDSRKKALLSLDCVDDVIIFEDAVPLSTIRHLEPDVLVEGVDGIAENGGSACADLMASWGGTIINYRDCF